MFRPRRPRFWLVLLLFVLYVAAGIVAFITIGRPDVALVSLAVITATIVVGIWLMRRGLMRHGGPMLIMVILMVSQASAGAFSLVAGVFVDSEIGAVAVPHASGAWGTDYLTATHGLRVSGNQITLDGRQFEAARPVVVCSGIAHGIDAMLLRVSAHPNRPVVTWGEVSDLKPGDELRVVPYDLPAVTVRLLHHVFGQWADRGAEEWPAEVHHALVAEARHPEAVRALAGYSGSPWVRNGRAYGLHKASAKVKDDKIVALAEPVARIRECFERMGYAQP